MVMFARAAKNRVPGSIGLFIGLSLFNLSIGFSIAIARTDNLSFSQDDKLLILGKEAEKLENKASRLINLSQSIRDAKIVDKSNVKAVESLKQEIVESKEEINELIDQ